ncbi:FAD-dependent pyridine nucleotide-disulphide oxidoreductase [Methylobacterium sp. 4-46]|uniref:NAD(P)/FAD-dependent oxidoreductase n=1 Tax=unclassified Methylobacterium TaxID=2615210 RepID=UPI000165C598|nr:MULTISPECIES: FAD-dependent oxidoreductase [Methylobacterium]ACA16734.1 FAD-dependent pyridine nucleotide-disulphide oxidoreductase [Methylobacterium sp. 4-46]WFT82432.1 FAD-dependent oxidoreductase [Methylobacterium nodulans]
MDGIVVVGAGQGGFQLGASLREGGYRGPVTLIGDEPGLPYGRPPLSKAYLAGKTDAEGLQLRPPAYYAEHGIRVRAGERVSAIDRSARQVLLASGEAVAYEQLVLATGARNRPLPVPGAELPGLFQLRSLAEADALRAALPGIARVAVVGAGFIGLEFAAVCAARGLSVTVIEGLDRALARALSPEMAGAVVAAHEAAGVRFRFGATVRGIAGETRARGVVLGDGSTVEADLVLVGIGVLPNQDLAEAAGLATGNGIHVDAMLATEDPAVSAIGDCAAHPSPHADGARVRIESVQNAVDGARCVAARLTGRPAAYAAVPWFWSDQGALKLQMAGLSRPDDAVVRRGAAGAGFSVFRYRGERLTCVESLNRPADHMIARRLIQAGVSPSPDQAADPAFDLKALALAA